MTTFLSLVLVLFVAATAVWATRAILRWVGSDGGAHQPHAQPHGEWSSSLPSVPYALR